MAGVNGFLTNGKAEIQCCLRHKLWWTVTWLSDGWLVWELGARSSTIESLGSWRVVKCCRNMEQSPSCLPVAMFTVRIIPRVSILRGIIIIVLLVVLAAAVNALHSQTKEVEIVRLVITPITMGAQIMPHAHFAGTGGVLVVILGRRQCRVFTLNTNWGQYYNEDFISILGKVEVRCGCWK